MPREWLKAIARTALPQVTRRWIRGQWRCLKRWRFRQEMDKLLVTSEPAMIARGWDNYADKWTPDIRPVLPGYRVQHIGDEWTAEDASGGGSAYGLDPYRLANFNDYINESLLNPHLPSYATEGLEIGPGGGRLTALLISRTSILHLAEPSKAMLRHLKRRFADVSKLRYYQTDGMTLPTLRPTSLDYVIAFDVFVHLEPRLIYWYLHQIAHLLRPGGTGIIHYANVLTPLGWQQFEYNLKRNVQKRTSYDAFGVMCPQLMTTFLEVLELEVLFADVGIIPRDAITVFRKPMKDRSGF